MKLTLWIATAAASATLILPAFGQNADRAEMALHAAMKKEAVDGDLKVAIEEYKKLAQSRSHTVAAKALVRMGECYEKLGDAEARKAYERVLRDFSDQKEAADLARKRLDAMERPARSAGAGARLIVPSTLEEGAVSTTSDGRYLLERASRGISIRDLKGGQIRRLTQGEDWSPVSSPDGNQVAFVRWANQACEAWISGFDGVGTRMLWRPEKDWCVEDIIGWFPDNKRFVAQVWTGRNGPMRLIAISAAEGSATTLWEGPWMPNVQLSPDGTYAVGQKRVKESPRNDELWLISLKDRSETPLLREPSTSESPVWTADGKAILFLSDRRSPGQVRDLWMLSLAGLKPRGRPVLVKDGLDGASPLGPVTRDGSYYYRNQIKTAEVLATQFDPIAGIASRAPDPVSRQSGTFVQPCISRDGRWRAYFRRSPPSAFTLVIQSLETGEEKNFQTAMATSGLEAAFFPDGRSLLVAGTHAMDGSGLHRLDAATGTSTLLKKGWFWNIQLSPDGKNAYYLSPDEEELRLLAWEIGTGAEREILRGKAGVRGCALSPGGTNVAVIRIDEQDFVIETMPLSGGSALEVYRVSKPEGIQSVQWSPDERYLFFSRSGPGRGPVQLLRVPAGGGAAEPIGVHATGMGKFLIHPDGRRIDFVARELRTEIWALENLLPKE